MKPTRLFPLICALFVLALASVAGADEVFAPGGVALEGYDPVAYFVDRRAVRGKKAHSLEHAGVTWYFASAENLELFRNSPADYTPEYGGYCAFGVAARQRLVRSDPTVFDIVDGKLYLNFNDRFRERWHRNQSQMIQRGDRNWPRLAD